MKYVYLEAEHVNLLYVIEKRRESKIQIPPKLHVYEDNCQCEILIPVTTRSIAPYAFENASHACTIVIPDTVSTLRIRSFEDFNNLSSVRLPQGLKIIPEGCFKGCKSLTNIQLPELTIIEDEAFYGCKKLECTLPKSIIEIGKLAFAGCKAVDADLTNIQYMGKHCFKSVSGLSIKCPNDFKFPTPPW